MKRVTGIGGIFFKAKDPASPTLRALLAALRSEGVQVEDKVDESEYGTYGWVFDPEGNKIELWQPLDGQ